MRAATLSDNRGTVIALTLTATFMLALAAILVTLLGVFNRFVQSTLIRGTLASLHQPLGLSSAGHGSPVEASTTRQRHQRAVTSNASHKIHRAREPSMKRGNAARLPMATQHRQQLDDDAMLAEHTDALPNGAKALASTRKLRFVTVDTRNKARWTRLRGELNVTNVGAGQRWRGPLTKNLLLFAWLQGQVKRDPSALAVLIDSDMFYGGCSTEQFLSDYHATVSASGGAEVVMGAEFGAYPAGLNVERWRDLALQYEETAQGAATQRGVLRKFNLTKTAYSPLASATRCKYCVCASCALRGKSSLPGYRYVNYGFVMGPVAALHKLLAYVLATTLETYDLTSASLTLNLGSAKRPLWIDQGAVAEYYLQHQREVTLDFSGALVLNLYAFKQPVTGSLLVVQGSNAKAMKVKNAVLSNRTACFIHGNGGMKKTTLDWQACRLEYGHVRNWWQICQFQVNWLGRK